MAECTSYFKAKTISLSTYAGRKPQTLMDAARHNLREIQAELGADGHIDAHRINDNVLLAGPRTAEGVQALAEKLRAEAGIDTSEMRRDHCQAIEVVFSLHGQSGIEPVAYFRRCLDWATVEMRLPLLSAVIHLDEAAPHLHVLILPVQGTLHVGNKPIAKKPLKALTESFFNSVAGPAGLKRMEAKMRGAVKRMAVAAVLGTCKAQGVPERVGVLWPILRMAIEQDPTAAVQVLNLSDEEIRAGNTVASKPIGLVDHQAATSRIPIGFQREASKLQNLSCVGFSQQTTSPAPAAKAESLPERKADWLQKVLSDESTGVVGVGLGGKQIQTLEELWAAVGCSSVPKRTAVKAPVAAKVMGEPAGGAAQVSLGVGRITVLVRAVEPLPVQLDTEPTQDVGSRGLAQVIRDDGDGVVRVRDEYADDLTAWDD